MKKIFLTIVLVFVCFSLYAYYEKNYPITVTQPDGAVVHCFTTGDEFYRWVHDENGFTLIQDPQTGVVVYARLENDELVSTGYRVGSVDPATVGLTPWQVISAEKRMQMRSDFLNNVPEKPAKDGHQPPQRGGHNNGTLNNLVIYIRFSDETEFPDKGGKYNDFFNKDEAGKSSMYAYFKAVSGEKTFIPSTFYPVSSGDVIISYQDIYPRSYFQPYNAATNPNGYQGGDNGYDRVIREHQLLKRAVEAVEDEIPTDLPLEFNRPGYVGSVCFIVRGSPGAWNSLLWPHRYWLFTETVTIHGKQVDDYDLLIETHLDGSGPSVLSHEMFHTLGAPDLYRYSDETIDPVGSWDLMCSNANPPQSTTAWMKYKYGGWIDDIPEITQNGNYTLHNVWSETNNAYRIPSPNSSSEFFVVEYRDKNVYWDSGLPGSGLLIYRINTNVEGNSDGPPDELYVFRPGGTNNTTNGNIGSANFSANVGRMVFNNVSNPPCFLSNNQPGDIAIVDIGEAGGETISFEVNDNLLFTELTVSPGSLTFANVPLGTTSEPQTITVSGNYIEYPISYEISGTGSELFTVEQISWHSYDGGTLSVTFTPDIAKIYNAKITFSSLGATPKSATLKGSGSAVAIDEQEPRNGIVVYPNPTNEEFKVSGFGFNVTGIEIFDVMGKKVQSSKFNVQGSKTLNFKPETLNFETVINISHLPSGIYFIRIQTENGVVVRKVVKQ